MVQYTFSSIYPVHLVCIARLVNNYIFIWKNTKIRSYQRLHIKETQRRRITVTSSLNIISTDQLGNTSSFPAPSTPEPECLNIEGAQESIPRNQFRQPLWMWPSGPVRQPYSYLVPSPHCCCTGPPDYQNWQNRFLGSLKVNSGF